MSSPPFFAPALNDFFMRHHWDGLERSDRFYSDRLWVRGDGVTWAGVKPGEAFWSGGTDSRDGRAIIVCRPPHPPSGDLVAFELEQLGHWGTAEGRVLFGCACGANLGPGHLLEVRELLRDHAREAHGPVADG